MYRLRVKEILNERKISMGRLSREANIPLNSVRRMCNDPTYQPRLDTLARAAAYLRVDASELYYDDGTGRSDKETPPEE